jgi:hypothetical protein
MTKTLCIAYMTGAAGSSVGLYYFGDGIVAGVDAGGMKYEGTYRKNENGSLDGSLTYVLPANVVSVTGMNVAAGQQITIPLKLPADFLSGRIVLIETPLGPINVKFELSKELP